MKNSHLIKVIKLKILSSKEANITLFLMISRLQWAYKLAPACLDNFESLGLFSFRTFSFRSFSWRQEKRWMEKQIGRKIWDSQFFQKKFFKLLNFFWKSCPFRFPGHLTLRVKEGIELGQSPVRIRLWLFLIWP